MDYLASLAAGVVIGVGLLWVRRTRRLRCTCGHPHWLLRPNHERLTVMVAYLVLLVAVFVWLVLEASRVAAVLYLLLIWHDGYRIWVHEHGRRRRAARAVGRVVLNVHGRLKVAPT